MCYGFVLLSERERWFPNAFLVFSWLVPHFSIPSWINFVLSVLLNRSPSYLPNGNETKSCKSDIEVSIAFFTRLER